MSEEDIQAAVDEAEEFDPNQNGRQPASSPRLLVGSDVELAQFVIDDLRTRLGEVVFCEGGFWYYTGTRWRGIPEHEVELAVQRYDGTVFRTQSNSASVVKLNDARVRSIIKQMAPKLTRLDFFSQAPAGTNCASGFIRFAPDGTPTLEPHRSEHRCRHVLKGHWTGALATEELDCWTGFSLLGHLLQGVFRGDPDAAQKVLVLQEIAGAAAIGYGTRLREPKAVILKGETAENGKSQILDIFRSLLPPGAVASIAAAKMADERFLPGLIGVHLNAADELSGAHAIASEAFKAVVTGEPVTGRDVYRSAVTFRSVAQNVFCTNALPSFAGGMDRGVRRRLLVIPFNRVIPKDERVEKIGLRIGEEEPDLLLTWAIEGASRLIRQRDFTLPPSSTDALKNWLSTADPVIAWAEAEVTAADPASAGWREARIKSGDAYSLFRRFAENEGFNKDRLPAINSFVTRLTAHRPTITVKHTNKGNWLTGINIDGYEPPAGQHGLPLGAPVEDLTSLRRPFSLKGEGVVGKSPSCLQ
jgi:P4 family phage/plasmid primase-like protien